MYLNKKVKMSDGKIGVVINETEWTVSIRCENGDQLLYGKSAIREIVK